MQVKVFPAAGFSKISRFLERVLVVRLESFCGLELELYVDSTCSSRTRSVKRDILETPPQSNINLNDLRKLDNYVDRLDLKDNR